MSSQKKNTDKDPRRNLLILLKKHPRISKEGFCALYKMRKMDMISKTQLEWTLEYWRVPKPSVTEDQVREVFKDMIK